MTYQTSKQARIVILFEAYLSFIGESSIRDFYFWLTENKITGYQNYTSRSIANIVKESYKFRKKTKHSSKWILVE